MVFSSFIKDKDDRNVINNVIIAFLVKGGALFVTAFSAPLFIRYFNNNSVLGLWYTILSILTWLSIFDFGIGNGLRNTLTEDLAKNNINKAKKTIASTYASLFCIMLPISILGLTFIYFIDFNEFFGITKKELDSSILRLSIGILFLGVAMSFVVNPINNIIYSLQKSSLNNIIVLISNIIPLVYIYVVPDYTLEVKFISLAVVYIFSIISPLLIATSVIFKKSQLKKLNIKFSDISFDTSKKMLSIGVNFFLAQIFFLILMSTNELIIAKYFSSDAVVQYSIYLKMFTFCGSLSLIAFTPLWSKITRDYSLKYYTKIKITVIILYVLSFFSIVSQFLIVPFVQDIINIWLKEDGFAVDFLISMSFAFFGGIYVLNTALTTIANGLGKMNLQIICYGVGSLLKFPIIITLKDYFTSWSIVILYNATVLLLFCFIQSIFFIKWFKFLSR